MTRKDYIKMAELLKVADDWAHGGMFGERKASIDAVSFIRAGLATMLAKDNSRFDRGKFMNAASYNGGGS